MRDTLPQRYDHAWLLAEIVDGYYRTEMATAKKDSRFALKREQGNRARDEERFARDAGHPADERAHERRAEKAAYLRDKLAEAADADERAAREDD